MGTLVHIDRINVGKVLRSILLYKMITVDKASVLAASVLLKDTDKKMSIGHGLGATTLLQESEMYLSSLFSLSLQTLMRRSTDTISILITMDALV